MSPLKTGLLAGSAILALSGSGFAQSAPPPADPAPAQTPLYDPQQLPVYKGQVQLFTLTPRGDIDGVVLIDGTEVKTPPHLSTEIAFAIKPGDSVTIHGLKAAALPLIAASSITDDASGKTVVDMGPDGLRGKPPAPPAADGHATRVQGKIRMVLHGPRGDVNGALLEDGTLVRLAPPEAARLSSLLQTGQTVTIEGATRVSPLGRLVEVTAIGASPDQMMPVDPGPGGKRGHKGPPPA